MRSGRWTHVLLALLLLWGCGSSEPASTRAASADDLSAFTATFVARERVPDTCPAQVVPGSVKVAKVKETGITWAIALIEPAPRCRYAGGVNDPPLVGPGDHLPWVPEQQVLSVFERKEGGPWEMNSDAGTPFPCPAPNGIQPGPGNGSLPPSVLRAFHLRYAEDCSTISNLPIPRS